MIDTAVRVVSIVLLATAGCGHDGLRGVERLSEGTDVSASPPSHTSSSQAPEPDAPEEPSSEASSGSEPGSAEAAPPAEEPDAAAPASVCERIEARAGACPGYGYDCPAYPESQSECLLDLLQDLSDPCLLFREAPVCAGPMVSEYGVADCILQECFAITRADACIGNYEILCDFIY